MKRLSRTTRLAVLAGRAYERMAAARTQRLDGRIWDLRYRRWGRLLTTVHISDTDAIVAAMKMSREMRRAAPPVSVPLEWAAPCLGCGQWMRRLLDVLKDDFGYWHVGCHPWSNRSCIFCPDPLPATGAVVAHAGDGEEFLAHHDCMADATEYAAELRASYSTAIGGVSS